MKVKVCGMRDSDNVQQLLQEIKPDWMGLIFYPKSSRYVSAELSEELKNTEVSKVGVFVNESIETILSTIEEFNLSVIQLHGSESPAYVSELNAKTDKRIWKVVSVAEEIDWEYLREYVDLVEYFLFDTATPAHGGSGKKFNWTVLESYPFEKGFILSGGLDEDSAKEILDLAKKLPQLKGVDLNSKYEDAPGVKNIGKLRNFKKKLIGSF
ncbi:phosphoribosylanthranilate isomerase [Algoriphagus halophilus]|uniref:N-(5'-phosphoribosyl)anthranilate isomerase n=1 Tax=Algoriphagus halophilus TaxID=226505 RepID=A0A1N6HEH8_9BACT|nr:phosphoribosylanthranilate isomerase [Algoriphagus halophilus]SIO18244.1 phosphoribosylanthranilate isomerase [Algoriphagus halophilus]